MASLIVPEEVMVQRRAGSVARNDGQLDSKNARIAMDEGLIVVQDGATDIDCDLPASAAEVLTALGGTVYRFMKEEGASTHYDADEQVTILRKGTIYLTADEACGAGAQVFVRFQGGNEGQVRTDVDTADAAALPGARFAETTAGAGPVLVTLNLPS